MLEALLAFAQAAKPIGQGIGLVLAAVAGILTWDYWLDDNGGRVLRWIDQLVNAVAARIRGPHAMSPPAIESQDQDRDDE